MESVSGRRGALAVKRTRKEGQKSAGRPEGPSIVRENILTAAETAFANLGYAGTTLREIANEADVTQALISYYFGSKFGLFKEVFLRHGNEISKQRTATLHKLLAKPGTPKVRDVVEAFLKPTFAFRATPEGRSFLRLQARLHTEPPQISYALRTEVYGDSTRQYVEAMRLALPNLPERDAYWRVMLMVGTYLYAFSDTHRLEELAPPGMYDPEDAEEMIDQVSRFIIGGFKAPGG